jgi:hypothetical protein
MEHSLVEGEVSSAALLIAALTYESLALSKGSSGAAVMRMRDEAGEIPLMISPTVAVERPT